MKSVKWSIHFLYSVMISLVVLGICHTVLATRSIDRGAQNKWESAIKSFEEWDARNSFPKDAVLFLGSSSIRWLKTSELFPEFPVINRGFGGAQISDINHYAKRIVLPYRPKVIVFHCGYNDLFVVQKLPRQVFNEFRKLLRIVRKTLPKTRILFMSLKPGPRAWESRHLAEEVNRMVKELSETDNRLFYVDVATGMLRKDGKPDPRDYQSDGIHLTYQADAKWAKLLRPTLEKVYNSDK